METNTYAIRTFSGHRFIIIADDMLAALQQTTVKPWNIESCTCIEHNTDKPPEQDLATLADQEYEMKLLGD